jgi:predicted O-methyltransferase YrrM
MNIFTEHWFSGQSTFKKYMYFDKFSELHFLEIGSFEGMSTICFLDEYLLNESSTITCVDPWLDYSLVDDGLSSYNREDSVWKFESKCTKQIFDSNIQKTNRSNKVIIHKGFSHDILPQLIVNKKEYDFIYIDANHMSSFVLTDAIFSWYLLKVGGMLAFDDYAWETVKLATDSFMKSFTNYIEIIHQDYSVLLKKIKW